MKTTKPIGQNICDRTRKFAIEIVHFYGEISQSSVGNILGRQLLRSGTSIGANTEEAQAAQSKKDFVHKMRIALKEARETMYWLKIFQETHPHIQSSISVLTSEVDEISRIIFSIIRNTENKLSKSEAIPK